MAGELLPIEIRRVHPDDFDSVWALHNDALEASGAHGGHGPWDDDLNDPLASYVDSGGDFLVAILSPDVVGMVGIQPVAHRAFEVKRMRVRPALQRKGIGTALLREAARIAARLGADRLVLDTTTIQVAAQRFYQRHGFAEVRRSRLERFELIHYEKAL